ncbi:MAG: hypothetical protein ACYTEQ_03935 [Planctomycetota bacterium]|jgi:hypothetical protein
MNPGSDRPSWQPKWNNLAVYAVSAAVVLGLVFLVLFTNVFGRSSAGGVPQLVWLLAAFVLLVMLITTLSKVLRILDVLQENNTKLERIIEALEKNRPVLTELQKGVRLSEAAKTIVFGDSDRELMRTAVMAKLQQQDLEAADRMIDEIARRPEYGELARQLREEAYKCLDASEQERIRQAVADIEVLFENYQWVEASSQIENLIKAYPKNEQAKALRQKLLARKEERKRLLLTAWDDAVQRQATDRSLEILKDLDQYLTPNEGLALQEAAKDVFRTKLHNLGVQFSFAVSSKNWARAVEVGQQITRDFPNSKMAGEIREKMDFLMQKAGQQAG